MRVELRAARAETNFGGLDSEQNEKTFASVGEQQKGCMIGAVFEPRRLKRKLGKAFHLGRCAEQVVTNEFQLLVEYKRWRLKDQENTWEQR